MQAGFVKWSSVLLKLYLFAHGLESSLIAQNSLRQQKRI